MTAAIKLACDLALPLEIAGQTIGLVGIRGSGKTNRAGYEAGGGSFNNAIGRLRTLELIMGRGEIRASEDFYG